MHCILNGLLKWRTMSARNQSKDLHQKLREVHSEDNNNSGSVSTAFAVQIYWIVVCIGKEFKNFFYRFLILAVEKLSVYSRREIKIDDICPFRGGTCFGAVAHVDFSFDFQFIQKNAFPLGCKFAEMVESTSPVDVPLADASISMNCFPVPISLTLGNSGILIQWGVLAFVKKDRSVEYPTASAGRKYFIYHD